MVDKREVLDIGYELNVKEKIYRISAVVGRGASCLVYDAVYEDCIGEKHMVRIKEFYPIYINLKRNMDGTLYGSDFEKDKFESAKMQFISSYRKNVGFRNKNGLINSTSNVFEMDTFNNTLYLIAAFDEGMDYRRYQDCSMKELLIHIDALARVIQKYHECGYLHLDIKPENIFVIPETAEHIILFDFDSITPIDFFKTSNPHKISYSDGFSAPEQLRGKNSRIGVHTDIYSIGALLFYKLFGRVPTLADTQLGAKIAVEGLLYKKEDYPPKLFLLLEIFFKKTITISVHARWKRMDEVIACLEKMLPLSDTEAFFIRSNFTYNESCFIGRSEELQDLATRLEKVDAVFLSGIGGIGKTEIAKRYAYIHKEEFETIVFLQYSNSLMETIASEELIINNLECTHESVSDRFEEKLKVLKEKLTNRDLVIIDNFDVEDDEQLERILNCCKSKFIFTTREDFRDYGYEQLTISSIGDMDETMELFEVYNSLEYSCEELSYIYKLLEIVDNHTMMIALLAKYLRITKENPKDLYMDFLKKEGVTSTEDTPVKHRKDRKLNANKVSDHLRILFDVSNFNGTEKEVLMALSLLGPVRIHKELFYDIFQKDNCEEIVQNLIQRGWVEIADGEKVSLHQIVLDLIYNDLNPDTANCTDFVKYMIKYFGRKEDNYTMKQGKERLASNFIERLAGDDYLLAETYCEYCRSIKWSSKLLNKAEVLCKKSLSMESDRVFANVEILRLRKSGLSENLLDFSEEIPEGVVLELYQSTFLKEMKIFAHLRKYMVKKYDVSKEDIDFQYDSKYTTIENLKNTNFKLFFQYIEDGYPLAKYLTDTTGGILLEVASALLYSTNNICNELFIGEEASELGFASFFLDAENILLYLYKTVECYKDNFSFEWKKQLFQKLIELYDEEDFLDLAQVGCVGNSEKSAFYSQKQLALYKEEENDNNVIRFLQTSYQQAAENALFTLDYHKAIELYGLAMKTEDVLLDEINYGLSEAYIGLGKYDIAEELLLAVLEYDKESELNPCFTYKRLEELYEKRGDISRAIQVCGQIIENQTPLKGIENDALTWVLIYEVKKLSLQKKDLSMLSVDELRDMECNIKRLLAGENLDKDAEDVFRAYYRNISLLDKKQDAFEIVHLAAKKYKVQGNEEQAYFLYRDLIEDAILKEECKSLYIQLLLEMADMSITGGDDDYVMSYALVKEAQLFMDRTDPNYLYWDSKIKSLKIEIAERSLEDFSLDRNELIRECDFYLVTEKDIVNQNSARDSFDLWKETVKRYYELHDEVMVLKSMKALKRSLEQCFNANHLREYCSVALDWYEKVERKEAKKRIDDLFGYFVKMLEKHSLEIDVQREVLLLFGDVTIRNQMYDEVIWFYLLAYLSLLKENMYWSVLKRENTICRERKELERMLDSMFEYPVEKDKIDESIRIMEQIIEGLKNVAEYKDIRKKVIALKEKNECLQIEFKH